MPSPVTRINSRKMGGRSVLPPSLLRLVLDQGPPNHVQICLSTARMEHRRILHEYRRILSSLQPPNKHSTTLLHHPHLLFLVHERQRSAALSTKTVCCIQATAKVRLQSRPSQEYLPIPPSASARTHIPMLKRLVRNLYQAVILQVGSTGQVTHRGLLFGWKLLIPGRVLAQRTSKTASSFHNSPRRGSDVSRALREPDWDCR